MKEQKESVRELAFRVKDSFSLRQFVMVALVAFCTAANIIMDYMEPGFDPSIFRNPAYWINLVAQQTAVIMIMLCVYSFMTDRETQSNGEISALYRQLSAAHGKLSEYALTQKFDDYVYVKNFERKKRAYRVKAERRIFKARSDERRKRLEKKRDDGLARIEYIRVRYDKIRIVEIFSDASIANPNDESMSDPTARTAARMLLKKVVSIVMFGVLLASITFDPVGFGWGMLIKTFIKLFQAAFAVYVGGSEGVRFARGDLLAVLQNRAKFVQQFIEAYKPSDGKLNELRTEDEQRRKEEAEEALRRRNAMSDGAGEEKSKA